MQRNFGLADLIHGLATAVLRAWSFYWPVVILIFQS